MKNKILITMQDGSVWSVNIVDVAIHRDEYREDSLSYFNQYPEEAIDWFQNNTNWGDIPVSQVEPAPEPDYSDFCNCEMEAID
jgi:hypothetical protein